MDDRPNIIVEVWRAMIDQKLAVISTVALSLLLAGVYAFTATPVFRAKSTISHVADDAMTRSVSSALAQVGSLAPMLGLNLGASATTDRAEAIAILKSRAFTEKFIESEGLTPILFADRWDEQRSSWILDADEDPPSTADAYRLFDTSIRKISEDKATGLLTVSIEWTDAELASEWTNQLLTLVDDLLRDRAIDEAERSIDFLQSELEETSVVELQQAIYRLIEAQVQAKMLARVREYYGFRVIDPAVTAEPEEHVRPNRPLIMISALLMGAMLGVSLALILQARRQPPGGTSKPAAP